MTRTLRLPKKLALLCLATFAVHSAFATIRYVNASVSGGANNGTSWANAYNDLQPALAAAQSGDQIWVAKGTYYPTTSTTNRTATFVMKNNVAIYGGFAGTETLLSQRNWRTNVTTLSGDVDHSTDPLVVTGSGNTLSITGNAGNSFNVVTNNNNLDSTAILEGFVIIGGNANNIYTGPNLGGGMVNSNSSPSLTNILFSGNVASYGGGLGNFLSSPIVANVEFSQNYALSYGGGVYNNNKCSPKFTNCQFSKNGAVEAGAGMVNDNSNPSLITVFFSDNNAKAAGGIYNFQSFPNLNYVVFARNKVTSSGGGMYNYASSPSFTNCLFLENKAATGGGINNEASSLPTFTNCIFLGNIAGYGGAMYDTFSSPNLKNSIIWNNSSSIYNTNITGANPMVTYSDIQGGYAGTGNINQEPLFVNAANPAGADGVYGTSDDGLALQSTSPCINTGSNAAIPAGVTTDIAGLPRIMGGTVDMGAYESASGVTTAFIGCPNVNLAIARPGYNTYKGEPMTIYNIDTTTGAATSIAGGPLKNPYTGKNMDANGFGLNSQDGFLYGIMDTISTSDTTAHATLYRIGSNYGAVPLGLIQPPPAWIGYPFEKNLVNPSAGTFDDQGNFYFLATYLNYQNNLSKIDQWLLGKISNVSSLAASSNVIVPTYTPMLVTSSSCLTNAGYGIYQIGSDTGSRASSVFQDIAYSNVTKKIYAYQVFPSCGTCTDYYGEIISIDPNSGDIACVGDRFPFGGTNNQTSGILTTANGSLIISLTSGDMYKSDLNSNGSYKGTITKIGASGIANLSGQLGSIRGDLASCGFGKPLTQIINPLLPQSITAFPNPVRGTVTISTTSTLNNATVSLIGLAGNIISQKTGVYGNTFQLNMANTASGVYMVEINQNGNISRVKLVKE